jgi:mRNA-degrading endonuclease toxin of MazEF toxin-antitoxin module
MFRRGCFYRVRLAGVGKLRPALVLSPDRRNERANSVVAVVAVPCSTTIRLGPWHVFLRKGEGGLLAGSVLKCENLTTVDKTFLAPQPLGGPLLPGRLIEVREAILRGLDYDL